MPAAQLDSLLADRLPTLPTRGDVNFFVFQDTAPSFLCESSAHMGASSHGWVRASGGCTASELAQQAAAQLTQLAAHVTTPQTLRDLPPVAPLSSKYELVFSLLLEDSSSPQHWNIDEALNATILPLINRLSPMVDFRVETQIVRHATLAQPPTNDGRARYYTYSEAAHKLLNINQ